MHTSAVIERSFRVRKLSRGSDCWHLRSLVLRNLTGRCIASLDLCSVVGIVFESLLVVCASFRAGEESQVKTTYSHDMYEGSQHKGLGIRQDFGGWQSTKRTGNRTGDWT